MPIKRPTKTDRPVEHLGVSHRQHEVTLLSVRFLMKLHFHEEGGGDFENYHLFHTCEPMDNLSPYDQRLSDENTTFFFSDLPAVIPTSVINSLQNHTP